MRYREFRRRTEKGLDAWSEVLLFDPISSVVAFALSKVVGSPKAPYLVTLLSALLRLVGAYLFWMGAMLWGVVFVILSIIADGIDGKLSRFLFREDPQLRGTLDFLLDHLGMATLILALGHQTFVRGAYSLTLGVLLWSVSYILMGAVTSTKFRLFAAVKHDPDEHLLEGTTIRKGPFLLLIRSIQQWLADYRLVFHPTMIDAEVLLFLVFPLVFHPVVLLVSIACIYIDLIVSGLAPIYFLLRET